MNPFPQVPWLRSCLAWCFWVSGCSGEGLPKVTPFEDAAVVSDSSRSDSRPSDASQASCENVNPVSSLGERCCPTFGIDACGPGLFCAAYDGRLFAACYPLHSREDGETCAADNECLSYRCNQPNGVCSSSPNAECTTANGCGPGPSSETFVCAGGRCRISNGSVGQPCGLPQDCSSNICVSERCTGGREGDVCLVPADCNSARCFRGACSSGNANSECAGDGDCSSGRCVQRRCSEGARQDYCLENDDCISNHCVDERCENGALGDPCEDGADCSQSLLCDRACNGSNCISTCTTGQGGAPCVSEAMCAAAGLRCSSQPGWRSGGLFGSRLAACASYRSCDFQDRNCPGDERCVRVPSSVSAYDICLPPGNTPNLSPCTQDSHCQSSICADYGDGIRLCSAQGTWGAPCEAGCAEGYACDTTTGTCGGVAAFICTRSYDGVVFERNGGCARGGLEACSPDPWNRKVCENESRTCTLDSECNGARCISLTYCRN